MKILHQSIFFGITFSEITPSITFQHLIMVLRLLSTKYYLMFTGLVKWDCGQREQAMGNVTVMNMIKSGMK